MLWLAVDSTSVGVAVILGLVASWLAMAASIPVPWVTTST
jgi:hypothetical protein